MKKLLSLLLTLAMLSTMFIVGATSVSAAAATTSIEEEYTPTYITVTQETSTTPNTQTITSGRTTKVNAYGTVQDTTVKRWHLLKFTIDEFDGIDAVTVKITNKRTTSGKIGLYPLTAATWAAAEAAIAAGGTLTENLIANPLTEYDTSAALDRTGAITKLSTASVTNPTDTLALTGTAQTNCFGDSTELKATSQGGNLVSYFDEAAKAGQTTVYMAIATEASSGKKVEINSCSLALSGVREIEGLGTKIIAEKTNTIDVSNTYHYAYTNSTGAESVVLNNATYSTVRTGNTTGNISRTYMSFDLSGMTEKDISAVKVKLTHAKNSLNSNQYSGSTTFRLVTNLDTTFGALELTEDKTTTLTDFTLPTLVEDPMYSTTVSSMTTAGTRTFNITELAKKAIADGKSTLDLAFDHYNYRTDKDGDGYRLYQGGTNSAPTLTITYTEELAADETLPAAKTFKFKGEVATEDAQVRLLVGIYDSTGALIDVVASEVLTNGTDTLELPVDLSAYSTAASVKCYFWDGTTLNPFMEPTTANVAATA